MVMVGRIYKNTVLSNTRCTSIRSFKLFTVNVFRTNCCTNQQINSLKDAQNEQTIAVLDAPVAAEPFNLVCEAFILLAKTLCSGRAIAVEILISLTAPERMYVVYM